MKEIVVTGLGATTPLGIDLPTTWKALLSGTSGVRAICEEWAENLPVRIAAPAVARPKTGFKQDEVRHQDRSSQLALIAAKEAWADAGLSWGSPNEVDPRRLLICVGTALGGMTSLLDNARRLQNSQRVSPFTIPMFMPNAAAAQIGIALGANAGVHAPVSACASSNEAIVLAMNWLRDGRAEIAVAGGTEAAINPVAIAGFAQAQALSRRNSDPQGASRPWDKDRDGFVMAEGSAMLVIETLEHAKSRNARIYGTLAGGSINSDAFDIVRPHPEHKFQLQVMTEAIHQAGLTSADISHVNAHASSTLVGDLVEAEAIAVAAPGAVVTSTKSITGHLLGAAGALEAVACVLTLQHGVVPPTINLEHPEAKLPINVATAATRLPAGDLAAVNNSFGFGGHNVAVVFTNGNRTV